MRTATYSRVTLLLLPLAVGAAGCLIDDTGAPRGQAGGPTASVPDSGGPARRENASKTLKDAREPEAAPEGTLDVKTSEPR